MADSTGLPVLAPYQAALDAVQAADADGDDLSDLDPQTLLDALFAETPTVADGIVAVADLAGSYLAGGVPAGQAAGVLANYGAVSVGRESGADFLAARPAAESLAQGPPQALAVAQLGSEPL